MIKNRITCAFIAMLLAVATVLSSCGTSPADKQDNVSNTAVGDADSTTGNARDSGADSTPDTDGSSGTHGTSDSGSPDDTGDVPAQGGIIAPDIDGTVSTPLMWHVTSESGGELYLLGSIHLGLMDTCLFADEVYDAFDACDALAVECDVLEIEGDMAMSIKALRQMVYKDGTSIRAHIDDATYETARSILEQAGYYNRFMDYYTPIVWQQTIDQILAESTVFGAEYGVDRYFLSEAKRLGKDVLEIEDYMETYEALASLSDKTQALLLSESVSEEALASYNSGIAQMYVLWKLGNLADVETYLGGETSDADGRTPEELECMEEYHRTLVEDRNKIMVDKAAEYLREGRRVFYVVGLAHMVGEGGIVESLGSMGYDVRQISFAKPEDVRAAS